MSQKNYFTKYNQKISFPSFLFTSEFFFSDLLKCALINSSREAKVSIANLEYSKYKLLKFSLIVVFNNIVTTDVNYSDYDNYMVLGITLVEYCRNDHSLSFLYFTSTMVISQQQWCVQ
jgi:hypothetical protein